MAPKTRSKPATPEPSTSSSTALAANSTTPSLRREGSRTRDDEVWDAKYTLDLATTTKDENVFLFVPNLIGYTRVVTAAASLFFMPWHPKICTFWYTVSCLLDAVDGHAARALGQTSKFGAVLDMVTDRCTTACLLTFLAAKYPDFSLVFMFLITLDFSSHYMHMYSTLATGSTSHKTVTQEVSRILWLYYNNSKVLFAFCFANECFFVCLYLNAFWSTPIWPNMPIPAILTPTDYTGTNAKLVGWLVLILRNLTWPQVIGAISFPLCFIKQVINVVQFWKASKILVGIDLAERKEKRRAALEKLRG